MSDAGATPRSGSSFAAVPAAEDSAAVAARNFGDQTVISSKAPIGDLSTHDIGKSLEGELLGPLVLKEFVGGGGMGAVFRALDTTLNREVAVKLLSHGQSQDDETLRRFKNEAQSAARLDHENIARVYHVGEDRGVHYIVFEFIEGVNLRDLVERNGALPLAEAISYTVQVAEALSHSSQRDVIHRDIKPSNVLITPDGKAKLVDMGLARLHQVEHSNKDLTASGVTLGTFDYISPEQARDPRSADVRSDLYSLGCSLYFMLAGRPPFPEGTVLQKLLQHQGDQPPDPREVRPDLPAEVTRIVAKLLAKNPLERYQQPAELSYDLVALSNQLGITTTPVPRVVVPPAPPRERSRLRVHLSWAVPLVALPIIVIALDYVWSRESDPPVPSLLKVDTPASTKSALERRATPTAKAASATGAGTPDAQSTRAGSQLDDVAPATPVTKATKARLANLVSKLSNKLQLSQPNSSGAASQSTGSARVLPDAPLPPLPVADGVLVVGDETLGPNVYSSLEAACSQAKRGDVIELRYTGRREERPITLANPQLTIRAKEGFKPVVVFRPAQLDPLKYARSMITVSGGQLRLLDLHLELEVGAAPAESWTLVEIERAELLRFEKCSLSIRNTSAPQSPYTAGVDFFQIKPAAGGEMMNMGPPLADRQEPAVKIELKDCILRGEATVLRSDKMQPVDFSWENGLLATSQRLVAAGSGAVPPSKAEHLAINLRHVTALVYGGLALLTTSHDEPYQLQTSFQISDSILMGSPSSALVEQRGSQRADEFRDRITWNANRNYYEGYEIFWRISDPITPAGPRPLDFNWWCQRWGEENEHRPSYNAIAWSAPPLAVRPFNAHRPEDYVLAQVTGVSSPLGGASDGLDAGFLRQLLPELPAPPLAEDAATKDESARQ